MVTPVPVWKLRTYRTMDGQFASDLTPALVKGSQRIGEDGGVDVTIHAPANRGHRSVTQPLKHTLVLSCDGNIVAHGVIYTRGQDAGSPEMVRISGKGIGSIFSRRKALSDPTRAKITHDEIKLDNMTDQQIAGYLVDGNINSTAACHLPINIPVIAGSSTTTQTIFGYELRYIGDLFRDIRQRGTDVEFIARFTDTSESAITYDLVTGDPLILQAGADHIWDASGEGSTVEITVTEDASEMATVAWATGNGYERTMAVSRAMNPVSLDDGVPRTEIDRAWKDESDPTRLGQYAAGLLADFFLPIQTWQMKVRADQYPFFGSYRKGDMATVILPEDHPTLNAGTRRIRIMGWDTSGGETVDLVVVPVPVGFEDVASRFPRRFYEPDPVKDLQAALRDASDRIDSIERSAPDDYTVTDADGNSTTYTATGPVGTDADGNAQSYGGGGIDIGVVTGYTVSSELATVTVEETSTAVCANWIHGTPLIYSGDTVTIQQRRLDGSFGINAVIKKGPALRNKLPYGKVWVDAADMLGYGAGKAIGYAADNTSATNRWKVYDLTTDEVSNMVMPFGYEQAVAAIYIDGTNVYATVKGRTVSYGGSPSEYYVPLFFKWDKVTKVWSLIDTGVDVAALTDNEWASVTDIYNRHTGGNPIFGRPTFATAKWTTPVANGSLYRWGVEVTVWYMTAAGTVANRKANFSTYQDVQGSATPSSPPAIGLAVGGDHAYITVHKSLNYIDLSTGASKFLKASTTGAGPLDSWFGATDTFIETCKVSTDGKMYTLSSPYGETSKIVVRSHSVAYATTKPVGSPTFEHGSVVGGYVQRDGLADEYVVSASIRTMDSETATGRRGALLKVAGNTTTTLVPPVDGYFDRTGDAAVYDITQLPDGSIVTTFEASSNEVKNGVLVRSGTYSFYQYSGGSMVKFTHA